MKFLLYNILIFIVFISCNTKAQNSHSEVDATIDNDTLHKEITITNKSEKDLPAPKGYKLLLPHCYRLIDTNPTKCLAKDWLELYEENGSYYLAGPQFSITQEHDDCAEVGLSCIKSKRNTIIFIKNPLLQIGEVQTKNPIKKDLLPNKSITYTHNDQTFSIGVYGSRKDNHISDEDWESYNNLSLYISKINIDGSQTQELFQYDSLHSDSYFKLLFAGDLNRDGISDFIIQTSTFYEEYTVYVYLSNKSETAPFFDMYAHLLYQFDC